MYDYGFILERPVLYRLVEADGKRFITTDDELRAEDKILASSYDFNELYNIVIS